MHLILIGYLLTDQLAISLSECRAAQQRVTVASLQSGYIRNDNDRKLISINVLEYTNVIINYVASTFYFTKTNPDPADPYPAALIEADNTTPESWVINCARFPLLVVRWDVSNVRS